MSGGAVFAIILALAADQVRSRQGLAQADTPRHTDRCNASGAATDRVAVLVETRWRPNFVPIVMNVLGNLGDKWSAQLFHGPDNLEDIEASAALRALKSRGRLTLTPISEVFDGDLAVWHQYNWLLTRAEFWSAVVAEHVLIFQLDSVLCANADHHIDHFVGMYDYIGAPWKREWEFRDIEQIRVGNGGLSLRRRSTMLECVESFPFTDEEYDAYGEDIYFGWCMRHLNRTVPTVSEASRFSMEFGFYPGVPVGVHGRNYHFGEFGQQLSDGCPEARLMLFD